MLKLLVVLCAVFVVTFAAQAIAPLDPIPDKFHTKSGCYIKELDKVLKVGELAASKKGCMQYTCGSQYVYIDSCGVVAAQHPCKTETKKNAPYPDCCPKTVC